MNKSVNEDFDVSELIVDIKAPLDTYKDNSEDILPGLERGSFGLIVGPSYIGKSKFTSLLCYFLAGLRIDLGFDEPIKQGLKSIYIGLEDSRNQLLNQAHAIRLNENISDKEWESVNDNLSIISLQGRHVNILDDKWFERLKSLCKGQLFCVIDTISKIHSMEETNENFNKLVTKIEKIAHETKCAILIVHHTPKPQKDTPQDKKNASRGGTSLAAAARAQYNVFDENSDPQSFKKYQKDLRADLIGWQIVNRNDGPAMKKPVIMKKVGCTKTMNGEKVKGYSLELIENQNEKGISVKNNKNNRGIDEKKSSRFIAG